jgi:septal ring factor EnvC (AmiA/AmiB activator)
MIIPTPEGIAAKAGGWLLGKLWPIGAIAALAASIYLGIALMGVKHDLKTCGNDKVALQSQNTQLTRDLAQARTNVSTLQNALNQQNAQLRNLSAQSQAQIAALSKQVDAANARGAVAEKRARATLSYKPQGKDSCERLIDVDRRFTESLK